MKKLIALLCAALLALPALAEDVTGTLIHQHGDDFKAGKSIHRWVVREDNGREHKVEIGKDQEQHAGKKVHIKGTRRAHASEVTTAPAADTIIKIDKLDVLSSRTPAPLALAAATTTDAMLVVLVKFTDTGNTITQAEILPEIGETAKFFAAGSYGRQTLAVTVTPWLTAQMATSPTCDIAAIAAGADAAATAAGYVVANYKRKVYFMPGSGHCGFDGLADLGTPYRAWINGKNERRVFEHEIGHTFSLLHAGSVTGPGTAQVVQEYGDWYSGMGSQIFSDFNSIQKYKIGWILPSEKADFVGTTATSYTLAPLEKAGGALYAVRIPNAVNFQRVYWVEYRTNFGNDEYVATVSGAAPGVQIRLAPPFETPAYNDDSLVFNTGAGDQQALPVGSTFRDGYGTEVSVVSQDATQATIRVAATGVTVIPTTTTLTADPNPSAYGARVVFVPTVAPGGITGNVRLTIDGVDFCNQMIWAGQPAPGPCAWDGATPGTHAVVAVYTGDSTHRASNSATLTQTVTGSTPPPAPPPPAAGILLNGSFEVPAIADGAYAYNPTAAGYAWSGGGVQANGSPFGAATAPDGRQTAFIQSTSVLSQTVTLAADNYTLTFKAARRACCTAVNIQPLKVTLDNVQIGATITPPASGYGTFSIPFAATAGAHVLAFSGTVVADTTTFLDAVTLTGGAAPPPAPPPPAATATTFTAVSTYTATVSGNTPTGTVKFGTIASCQAVPLVAGVATCTVPFTPSISVFYSGDANNAASQSQ